MTGIVREGFGGPGGWGVAMQRLGMTGVGFEIDEAACATRAAAGHPTVRADLSRFPVAHLAGKVTGSVDSPPCVFFSAAGTRAGTAVIDVLADAIRDQFAGRKTLARRRREMAAVLRKSGWPDPKAPRSPGYSRMTRRGKRQVIATPGRGNVIWNAVRSASLVVEPARFIAATLPEWVALEQVPDVLPLWRVYAAELRKLGYSTWCGKLNAADYGVPQTRIRAILIASRVRRVSCPAPTHYDPRKGMQLFGDPWISMAEALGMGATARPAPTVTAGGTKTGGADSFARGGRGALEAERDAGRWVLGGPYRTSSGDRTRPRGLDEPATTVAFGHSSMAPAQDHAGVAEGDGPEATWMLHTNRDQRPDGSRQIRDPRSAPAPALTAKSGGQWVMRRNRGAGLLDRGGDRRDHVPDEPSPAITAGNKGSGPRLSWVHERPAGHKDRSAGGESQFAEDSVRVSVAEAAALQSFPAGYPWQGNKTKQYEQVGNAVPPGLAIAVLGEAAGIDWQPVAAKYALETRLTASEAA